MQGNIAASSFHTYGYDLAAYWYDGANSLHTPSVLSRRSLFAQRWPGDSSFSGKERDSETGLDFFGARYFSGAQGRFTGPDEPFADQWKKGKGDVPIPDIW